MVAAIPIAAREISPRGETRNVSINGQYSFSGSVALYKEQGFKGMKQDISESSVSPDYYFEARNMNVYQF